MLEELTKSFLEQMGINGKSENTLKNYRFGINKFFNWYKEEENIEEVDLDDIKKVTYKTLNKFKEYCLDEKGYKRSYVNNILMGVNGLYKFLGNRNIMDREVNPVRASGTLVVGESDSTFLELEEVKRLNEALENKKLVNNCTDRYIRNKLMVKLLYGCGLRCAEMTALKFSSFVDDGNGQYSLIVYGKGRKERMLALPEEIVKLYKEWLNYRRKIKDVKEENSKYVFLSNKKTKFSNKHINRLVQMYVKEAKINKRITTHKMRHTFATNMLKEVEDVKAVSDLLGHKEINTTLKYLHTLEETKNLTRVANPFF